MSRYDDGVMTPEEMATFESMPVARFATVDAAGRPHVVPVCFAIVESVIYTPIDEKPKSGTGPRALRRIRNILARPSVCLLVDRYDDDWSRLWWTQARGVASLVDDDAELALAIAALRARYQQYRTMDLESRPMIRIMVNEVVRWSWRGV